MPGFDRISPVVLCCRRPRVRSEVAIKARRHSKPEADGSISCQAGVDSANAACDDGIAFHNAEVGAGMGWKPKEGRKGAAAAELAPAPEQAEAASQPPPAAAASAAAQSAAVPQGAVEWRELACQVNVDAASSAAAGANELPFSGRSAARVVDVGAC